MSLILEPFDFENEFINQRKLFAECFPENNGLLSGSDEHYFWKFKNKSLENTFEYVAKTENELLGYYAALTYNYSIGKVPVKVGMVCDVMTGVKSRGKGVFTKLGQYSTECLKNENIDFTTGYPIRKEVIPGHLKAGWEKYFELPLFISLIKSKSLLQNRRIGYLFMFIDPILYIISNYLGRTINNLKVSFEYYNNSNIDSITGLENFLLKWESECEISLIKRGNFLKWRLNAPGKSYQIITMCTAGEIIGYTILTEVIKDGVPSTAILDYIILNEYLPYSKYLLNKIYHHVLKVKSEAILLMTNKSTFKKYGFNKFLFLKSPYSFYLIIKSLSGKISTEILKDENNWNLFWLDSDDL